MIVLLGLPSSAAAQAVVGVEAAPTCRPLSLERVCSFGLPCVDPGHVCRDFGDGNGFCAAPEALFCATPSAPSCPTGQRAVPALGLSVCIPVGGELCSGPDLDQACFTKAGSPSGAEAFPVDWNAGDCDDDGLANVDELPAGLCAPPPRIAISRGDGCEVLSACDGTCLGDACVEVEGTGHRYCLPTAEGFVYCCGGFLGVDCPSDAACQTSGSTSDDHGFCRAFDYCPELEFAARLACLEGVAGFPVEPDDGDCDEDGVPNGAEVPPRDPCVPDGESDAGVSTDAGASLDGGVSPILDAGAPIDAGSTIDAGSIDAGSTFLDAQVPPMDAASPDPTPLPPQFAGGGGCRCRAAPSRSGEGALALVAFAALVLARRRQGA